MHRVEIKHNGPGERYMLKRLAALDISLSCLLFDSLRRPIIDLFVVLVLTVLCVYIGVVFLREWVFTAAVLSGKDYV